MTNSSIYENIATRTGGDIYQAVYGLSCASQYGRRCSKAENN